jgi:hypothetical protein
MPTAHPLDTPSETARARPITMPVDEKVGQRVVFIKFVE